MRGEIGFSSTAAGGLDAAVGCYSRVLISFHRHVDVPEQRRHTVCQRLSRGGD